MAIQILKQINAPPIRELRPLSQLVFDQLPEMFQDTELSDWAQFPNELELARAPNIHRNTFCKIIFFRENEGTVFQGCGGYIDITNQLNLHDNVDYDWWKKQTIEIIEKLHSINTYIFEWFLPYLIFQLVCQYFKQEIKLTKVMLYLGYKSCQLI